MEFKTLRQGGDAHKIKIMISHGSINAARQIRGYETGLGGLYARGYVLVPCFY